MMEASYPKKMASYTRAFNQDYSNPCFCEVVTNADEEANFRSKHHGKDIRVLQLPEMTADAIMILIIIKKHGGSVSKPRLIPHFFSAYSPNIDLHIDVLKEFGLIDCVGSDFSITGAGEEYLDDYHCTGVEDVYRKGFQYAVLKFLYNIKGMMRLDYFPQFLIENCPRVSDGSKTLDLIQYLGYSQEIRAYILEKNGFYGLSSAGRRLCEIENASELRNKPVFESDLFDLGIQIAERRQVLMRGGIIAANSQNQYSEPVVSLTKSEDEPKMERGSTVEHHYHAPVTQTSINGNNGTIVHGSTISGGEIANTFHEKDTSLSTEVKPGKKKTVLTVMGGIVAIASAVVKLITDLMHR